MIIHTSVTSKPEASRARRKQERSTVLLLWQTERNQIPCSRVYYAVLAFGRGKKILRNQLFGDNFILRHNKERNYDTERSIESHQRKRY
jgi:hypothetical protein